MKDHWLATALILHLLFTADVSNSNKVNQASTSPDVVQFEFVLIYEVRDKNDTALEVTEGIDLKVEISDRTEGKAYAKSHIF